MYELRTNRTTVSIFGVLCEYLTHAVLVEDAIAAHDASTIRQRPRPAQAMVVLHLPDNISTTSGTVLASQPVHAIGPLIHAVKVKLALSDG
ncbi:hypothetical protein LSH36_406g02072 [Paralvinella palmiformis]|uniref:Uncharacterized protein n=1 Tax=Paralvinella palmiformis TaxID=53620 RepID=A0AAD9JCT3_9ANNE|nr:hypothetical protein LSH36_406g02072 [Paralvinella palmiformis]